MRVYFGEPLVTLSTVWSLVTELVMSLAFALTRPTAVTCRGGGRRSDGGSKESAARRKRAARKAGAARRERERRGGRGSGEEGKGPFLELCVCALFVGAHACVQECARARVHTSMRMSQRAHIRVPGKRPLTRKGGRAGCAEG